MSITRRSVLALTTTLVVGATAAVVPTLSSAAAASHPTTQSAQRAAGSYTSKVFGTWRNGAVRGSFVPVRSFVRNHETWVQGDLTAKVRKSDGTLVGSTTRRDVAIPVTRSGAHMQQDAAMQAQSCKLLHLVLGPLNLNLLGLHVHLNRVVLDLTAQSGSGNLLGNLLCAVAHLLDNTSPSLLNILQLSSLLNRLIGQLT